MYLYEGFVDYLSEGNFASSAAHGREFQAPVSIREAPVPPTIPAPAIRTNGGANTAAQSKITTESIAFPYDMEFFIQRVTTSSPFPEQTFRKALEQDGDSIILIEDEGIVKVHVHSRRPGDVINFALTYGEITHIHILNMQEQHRELLAQQPVIKQEAPAAPRQDEPTSAPVVDYALPGVVDLPSISASPESEPNPDVYELASYGVVAVSVGEGNAELFRSLGVDIVLSGGQSMNPSTEDLLGAITSLSAHHIFVLPNNPNIIMAAKQAAELAERPVTVLQTRTLPQGMAAMLAFQENDSETSNIERMTKAYERVVTGSVTQAVRDTEMDGVQIKEGHYIGIKDKTIVASASSPSEACKALLTDLLVSGGEVLTILTGDNAEADQTEELEQWLAQQYPDVEVEVHEGGQPLYPYLFAVEP